MAREGDILDGKYLLRRLLGDGGMGNVFLAENVKLGNKPFAVKTLKPEYLANRDLVGRFLGEALAASKVEHDNIVEVFDADIDAATGTAYIVQRYLKGTNLREYLNECPGRRLVPTEALEVLVPIMGALVATHKQRIIHRDIKPENIFLVKTSSGNTVPKLIDFGIAKHLEAPSQAKRANTRSGSVWGTFDYMSPEQARGETDCDARADIWSMGAVLFETLTGRLPYEVDGHHALLQRMLEGPPPRVDALLPTVPRDVADIVERALQVEREARWPTMAAFISAVINCQCYQGTVAWRAIPLSSPDLGEIPDLSSLARFATEEHPLPARSPSAVSPDETAPIKLSRVRAILPDISSDSAHDNAITPSTRTLELVLPEPWSPRKYLPAVVGVAAVLVGILVGLQLQRPHAHRRRPAARARTAATVAHGRADAPARRAPQRPLPGRRALAPAVVAAVTPQELPPPAPVAEAPPQRRVAAPRVAAVSRPSASRATAPRLAAPAPRPAARPAPNGRAPVIQTEF